MTTGQQSEDRLEGLNVGTAGTTVQHASTADVS